jgi:hypothetical protein
MAGWSTIIQFGLVGMTPLALLPKLRKACAGFAIQKVCPLGWTLESTSRQRKESEGFFPLLDQCVSLRNVRNEQRIKEKLAHLLEDPACGGVVVSYDWQSYAAFFSDRCNMYPPSFQWYICPQETSTVLLLRVEFAIDHLNRTSEWRMWFHHFLDQATTRLSARRWQVMDDDDDLIYASLD